MLKDTLGRNNRKIADRACENCGKIFRPVDSKKRSCSRECGYAIRKNPNDGRKKDEVWWINPKGYVEGRLRKGESVIRVRQHRWIMEQHLGRPLLATEDVHHINGNKKDNRPENLRVIDHGSHTIITNNRPYKKGYKLNLSDSERQRRKSHLRSIKAAIKKATE